MATATPRKRPKTHRQGRVLVGTSGWTYDGWRGPFYPADVPKRSWLQFYAGAFPTTEINGSFYRTPSPAAVAAWRDGTPTDFVFAWKASKFITHWKRLLPSCANSIALMETRLHVLGAKLGPVLFQLPRRFEANHQRLADFLHLLPPSHRYAFEFRHESWWDARIFALLRDFDVALCIGDHHDAPSPWETTASFAYVRAHGPTGRYHGNYPDATLAAWAQTIRSWRRRGHDAYVYFDNDVKSAAVADARRLEQALDRNRR